MKINIKNIILMVLSLVLSVALWLYVMSVTDVDGTREMKNIKVNLTGQESLSARGLSVIDYTREISLTFKGRRTELFKLDGISVNVDLSDILSAGTSKRYYTTINWPDGVNGNSVMPLYLPTAQIELFIDKMSTKVVPVRINYTSSNIELLEGHISQTPIIEPAEVRINGPETILETVTHAELLLYEEALDRTVERTREYTLVNASGDKVEHPNLEKAPLEVLVVIPVSKTKTVPVVVEFKDGGGITLEDNVDYEFQPSSITLSGDAAVLEGINSLKVGPIDLSKVSTDRSYDFPIQLPDDCVNLSGVSMATVNLQISGAQSKVLSVNNIEIINADVPDGYILSTITKSVTVTVRGPENLVGQVEAFNIRVVADLAEQTLQRQMTVNATVYVDGFSNRIGAVGDYRVALELVPDEP